MPQDFAHLTLRSQGSKEGWYKRLDEEVRFAYGDAMIVRLIPYTEIHVSITLTLAEAKLLTEGCDAVYREFGGDIAKLGEKLQDELWEVTKRADAIQAKRDAT